MGGAFYTGEKHAAGVNMAQERLSELQRWILRIALEGGRELSGGGKSYWAIERRSFIVHRFGLYRNNTSNDWDDRMGRYLSERNKFNASLTRSLQNLTAKGLIKNFYHLNGRKMQREMKKDGLPMPRGGFGGINKIMAHKDEDIFKVSIQTIALTDKGIETAFNVSLCQRCKN